MKEIWGKHKSTFIGALTGLIIALLVLTLGFFKTVVLLIFVLLGGSIGWTMTNTEVGNYLRVKKKRNSLRND